MSMFEDYEPSTKKSKDRKKSKTSINQAPQGKEPLTSKTSKIKPPLDTKIKPSKKPKDDILAQIFDQKKKISKENPSKLINGSSSIHFKAKEPSALLSMKEERRRFMSHKAAKIVDGPSVVDQGRESSSREKPGVIGRDEGDGLSPEEFKKMQREVLLYGKYKFLLYYLQSVVVFWVFFCCDMGRVHIFGGACLYYIYVCTIICSSVFFVEGVFPMASHVHFALYSNKGSS